MSAEHFPGRLYLPAGEPAGLAASVCWQGDHLRIEAGGGLQMSAPHPRLRFSHSGFNHAMLQVAWTLEAGGEAVLVFDGAATRTLSAHAPAACLPALHGPRTAQQRLAWRWRLGWAVLGALLAVPLVLLALLVWRADAIAGWVVERIPPSLEAKLGDLVLEQTRAGGGLQEHGPAVAALRHMGARLGADAARYRWYVADRDEVNAFAAPGGVVVVFRGLLQQAESAEEVAGVVAHEIAHVELRHSLRAMVKSLGLRALLSMLMGDYASLAGSVAELGELKFSRDAEREADERGLQMLLQARIDPAPMAGFFRRMAQQQGGALPALLSTHPAPEERLQWLEARIAERRPAGSEALAIDWAALRAGLAAPLPR